MTDDVGVSCVTGCAVKHGYVTDDAGVSVLLVTLLNTAT